MFLPRVIRLRDAPHYLGMNINRFNEEVRPYVTEVRIGSKGVAFDRTELDEWFQAYKSRNGRPPARTRREPQRSEGRTALIQERSSTSRTIDDEYKRALELPRKRGEAS